MAFRMMGNPRPCSSAILAKHTNKAFLVADQENTLAQHGSCFGTRTALHVNISAKTTTTTTTGKSKKGTPKIKLLPENRVNIQTLMTNLNQVMHGKFFLCRVIMPAFEMSSIMTIVEDPEEELAVRIALYNYPTGSKSLDQVLPVGLILAVKNPWFKSAMDGSLILRCDNRNDVVTVDEAIYAELFPNLGWKGEIPVNFEQQGSSSNDDCEGIKEEVEMVRARHNSRNSESSE